MTDHPTAAAPPEEGSPHDLAPRPRPGFKSQGPKLNRMMLFAGVLRATAGLTALFGSLLFLPVHIATPVLSGIAILMMVTGTSSVWNAVREHRQLHRIPVVMAGLCTAASVVIMGLTLHFGAGAFGPVRQMADEARAAAAEERALAPATIRFAPAGSP